MSFEVFFDSRGKSHLIYIQDKHCSCGIACIATVMSLISNCQTIEESYLRLASQQFKQGYKPHPADVGANQRTFIAALMEKEQQSLPYSASQGFFKKLRAGTGVSAIAQTLALYNFYSDKKTLAELSKANTVNYASKLKSKITLLGVKNYNQCDHAIIVRDIWEDGTWIIYDPACGLVETKQVNQYYNLFPYKNSLTCSFTVPGTKTKEMDLEEGFQEAGSNEMIASDFVDSWATCILI